MYTDIKKNKWKSAFIVSGFIVFLTVLIYFICQMFELGSVSIVIALIFSILSAWGSYYYSDKIVLSLNHARPATHEENQKIVNILDALVVASGMEYTPKLYIVDDPQPNAFATGRNPKNSVICLTTGLLDTLDYYELEGVIGHELAHIKNYDILLSAVVSVMVGLIVMVADITTRALFWGVGGRDSDNDNGNGNAILFLIGLVLLILSPIFSKLMQLALSRRREFLADATSVSFTRNPDGLISALRKLDADEHELKTANRSTANMFIVCPFKKNTVDSHGKTIKRSKNLFSTHPSIEDRIAALESLR